MNEDTLYEEGKLKITYLHSPELGEEGKVTDTEEHELWIGSGGTKRRHILQRGVLRELAIVAKERPSALTGRLMTVDEFILHEQEDLEIPFSELKQAFIGAYDREEELMKKYLAEQEKD